jgi:hypothetical protein
MVEGVKELRIAAAGDRTGMLSTHTISSENVYCRTDFKVKQIYIPSPA